MEFKMCSSTSYVRGINLPIKPCDSIDSKLWSYVIDDAEEHFRYLKEGFVVRDDDVFICTYPRSGTNWTYEIVKMLLKGKAEFANLFGFAECLQPKLLDEMKSPRVICSHMPLRFLPPKLLEKGRIICVLRNPKDVAVSYHNYLLSINFIDYTADWSEFLNLFLDSEVASGSWFDHVREWETVIENNASAKILPLKYEDMKSDMLTNIKIISEFLGLQHDQALFMDIHEKCEFESLYKEKNKNVFEFIKSQSKDAKNFLYRKGEIGDWKNWFTVAQNERFDKIYQERMKDSNLHFKFS